MDTDPSRETQPKERQLGTVERAYELARSGSCATVEQIRMQLSRERHESVQQHLSGPTIRRELSRLCKAARG
jgi:hypothetical protein